MSFDLLFFITPFIFSNFSCKETYDHRRITSHWELILNPLFSQLLLDAFLFTENNGGKWIKSTDAVFSIFKEDTSDGKFL
jgi:hypothetical protein